MPGWLKFLAAGLGIVAFAILIVQVASVIPTARLLAALQSALIMGDGHSGGWIFEYQTLIAGMLAIFGAVVTVLEMQRSDANARKRHEQLVRLSVHGETLKLHQGLVPAVERMRGIADAMKVMSRAYETEGLYKIRESTWFDAQDLLGPLDIILASESMKGALSLVDGRTMARFNKIHHLLTIVMSNFKMGRTYEPFMDQKPQVIYGETQSLEKWLSDLDQFAAELMVLNSCFERLGKTYGFDCYAEEWVDPALDA